MTPQKGRCNPKTAPPGQGGNASEWPRCVTDAIAGSTAGRARTQRCSPSANGAAHEPARLSLSGETRTQRKQLRMGAQNAAPNLGRQSKPRDRQSRARTPTKERRRFPFVSALSSRSCEEIPRPDVLVVSARPSENLLGGLHRHAATSAAVFTTPLPFVDRLPFQSDDPSCHRFPAEAIDDRSRGLTQLFSGWCGHKRYVTLRATLMSRTYF